jgi:hypothetical protein
MPSLIFSLSRLTFFVIQKLFLPRLSAHELLSCPIKNLGSGETCDTSRKS